MSETKEKDREIEKKTGKLSGVVNPTYRTMYYAMLLFWGLLSVYSTFFFTLRGDSLDLFTKIWLVVPVVFISYLLYGYIRVIVGSIKRKRTKEASFVTKLRKDKDFRSIFTKTGGIITSFFFAALYCAKGFMMRSGFYWFLAEFYLVAAILKLYLNTIAETQYSKNDEKSYIIVYVVAILLAAATAGVTYYVVFFDGIFEKSKYLVGIIAAFTIYKIVSAGYSFNRARKNHARLDLATSLIALSSALFSIYTLAVALMILITDNPSMKQFAYLGFGSAVVIFVLAIIGLVNVIKAYRLKASETATEKNNWRT